VPGSLLGAAQKTWIADEVAAAPKAHRLLVLVSSVPWNGAPTKGPDRWQAYPEERAWLAGLIKSAGIRACVLAGDAHMVAIDDGSNADFAPGWPMPVFQAAALSRPGSYKAGPYSHGAHPGSGQFGLMTVDDDGKAIRVQWSAREATDGKGEAVVQSTKDGKGRPIAYTFTVE
jgi:hypothetical protein